jgi:DNA-binding response OmpR family regulator
MTIALVTRQTLKDRQIVVIEDTHAIRTILRYSLEAEGATLHEAATAAYGLALCEQYSPDVVLLDLGLPDNEGFNILPRLKRTGRERETAVVVLTVRKESADKSRAMELGASAYVTKPFVMEHLIEVIESALTA